ncbi:hypothetical protein GEMRC1_003761 [Eukaryota sp. GEM-RC1]
MSFKQQNSHAGFDLNRLAQHARVELPLDKLTNKRIAFDASQFIDAVLKMNPSDWEVWPIGGVPRSLTRAFEESLSALLSHGIYPIFVFPGLLSTKRKIPSETIDTGLVNAFSAHSKSASGDRFRNFRLDHKDPLLEHHVTSILISHNIDFFHAPYKVPAQLAALLHQHHVDYVFGNTYLALYCSHVLSEFSRSSTADTSQSPSSGFRFFILYQDVVAHHFNIPNELLLKAHLIATAIDKDSNAKSESHHSKNMRFNNSEFREIFKSNKFDEFCSSLDPNVSSAAAKQYDTWMTKAPVFSFEYTSSIVNGLPTSSAFVVTLEQIKSSHITRNNDNFQRLFSDFTHLLVSQAFIDYRLLTVVCSKDISYYLERPSVDSEHLYHLAQSLSPLYYKTLSSLIRAKKNPHFKSVGVFHWRGFRLDDTRDRDSVECGGISDMVTSGDFLGRFAGSYLRTGEAFKLPHPIDLLNYVANKNVFKTPYELAPEDKSSLKCFSTMWLVYFIERLWTCLFEVVNDKRQYWRQLLHIYELLQLGLLNEDPIFVVDNQDGEAVQDSAINLISKIFSFVETDRKEEIDWKGPLIVDVKGFTCMTNHLSKTLGDYLSSIYLDMYTTRYRRPIIDHPVAFMSVGDTLRDLSINYDGALGHLITAWLTGEVKAEEVVSLYSNIEQINESVKSGFVLLHMTSVLVTKVQTIWPKSHTFPPIWKTNHAQVIKASEYAFDRSDALRKAMS